MTAAAFGERFPFEGQCGVHEHSLPDQVSNDAIEFSGLHPLIQRRVLVAGFEVHAADGLFGPRTGAVATAMPSMCSTPPIPQRMESVTFHE